MNPPVCSVQDKKHICWTRVSRRPCETAITPDHSAGTNLSTHRRRRNRHVPSRWKLDGIHLYRKLMWDTSWKDSWNRKPLSSMMVVKKRRKNKVFGFCLFGPLRFLSSLSFSRIPTTILDSFKWKVSVSNYFLFSR